MVSDPSCSDCRYAHVTFQDDGDPGMECRRYPPTFFVILDEPVQAFPTIDSEMWCGEHTRPAPQRVEPPLQPGVPTIDLLEPQPPLLTERLRAWLRRWLR